VCQVVLSDLIIHCLPRLFVRLPRPACLIVRMLVERIELEKFIEEVLNKFMADKAMSEGV
jgi:hypothetical protein